MPKYYTFNDLLKDEIELYAISLCNEIYGGETDEEVLESDENLDLLYSGLNDYINLDTEEAFMYNNSEHTSLMCKLMIMANFYEYGTICFDELDDMSKQIYNRLSMHCNMKNALSLYNTYHREVLENYDFIFSIELDEPEYIDEIRFQIIEQGELNNVLNIYPYAIFDYRFLFGLSFEGEHIKSVNICNALKTIVSGVIVDNDMTEESILSELQSILKENPDIVQFVDDNKSYMLSNIYERYNFNKNKTNYEKCFMQYLEDYNRDDILNNIVLDNQTLSSILYCFYVLNKKRCDESELQKLRDHSKQNKRLALIKQYNPFYIEEESYFKNRRSSNETS